MNHDTLRALVQKARDKPVSACWLIVAVLYWPCLAGYYLFDDFFQLRMLHGYLERGDFADHWGLLNLFELETQDAHVLGSDGALPWWASRGLQINFWRPLSSALAYFDYLVAPESPFWAHLHNLLWLCAFLTALRWLLLETHDQGQKQISWVALLTLVVTSMNSNLSFVTTWIANRNALIATTMVFAAIAAYARGQRHKGLPLEIMSAAFLTAGLLAGEIAWSCIILWAAFVIWGDSSPWKTRLWRLRIQAPICVAWILHYVWFDLGAKHGGFYVNPVSEVGKFIQVAPERFAKLLAYGLGFVIPQTVLDPERQHWIVLTGCICFGLACWVWYMLERDASDNQRATLRWMGIGGMLTLVPVLGTMPCDRLLVPFFVCASFLYASLMRWLAQRRQNKLYLVLLAIGLFRHLLLSSALTLGANAGAAYLSRTIHQQMVELEQSSGSDRSIQLRVLLNSPGPALAWTLPSQAEFVRGAAPVPWLFAAASRETIVISRVGPRSLELSAEQGSLISGAYGALLRSKLDQSRDPLQVGTVLKFAKYRVRINEIDRDFAPKSVTMSFDRNLDDPSMQFYEWRDGAMHRVRPPESGQRSVLPWSPGPSGL